MAWHIFKLNRYDIALCGYYVTILIHSWCIQFGHIMAMVRWWRWRTEDVSGVRVRSPGRGWRNLPRDIGDTAIGPPSLLSRLSSVPGRWWPGLCSLLLHPHFVCKSDSPSWHVQPVSEALWSLCIAHSAATRVKSCCSAAGVQECKCRVLRMQH